MRIKPTDVKQLIMNIKNRRICKSPVIATVRQLQQTYTGQDSVSSLYTLMLHQRVSYQHLSATTPYSLSYSRGQLMSSKLHQLVLCITVHSVVAPSGELHGKGRCGVFAGKTVWSTPERLRGEVLTTKRYTNYVYLYLTLRMPSKDGLGSVTSGQGKAHVLQIYTDEILQISCLWMRTTSDHKHI